MACKPLEGENKAIAQAIGWPEDAVIYPFTGQNGRRGFSMWCPGCKMIHIVNTAGTGPLWGFAGTAEKPSFTPSIRVRWSHAGEPRCCHCFIRDGEWQFLSDCTHDLAGQNVPMVPDPTRLV